MNSTHAADTQARRTDAAIVQAALTWRTLCRRADLVANSGVVAWLDGRQVAVFYLPDGEAGEQVFAVENRDPRSGGVSAPLTPSDLPAASLRVSLRPRRLRSPAPGSPVPSDRGRRRAGRHRSS